MRGHGARNKKNTNSTQEQNHLVTSPEKYFTLLRTYGYTGLRSSTQPTTTYNAKTNIINMTSDCTDLVYA